MKITGYRNNPPRDGWFAIALGIFVILLVQYIDPVGSNPDTGLFHLGASGTRKPIEFMGVFFIAIGLWLFVWSPKRKVSIDHRLRRVTILDTSRFKKIHLNIPFASISEVFIDQWNNFDLESRTDHYEYWLSIRLLSGESVEITDRTRHRDKIEKIRDDVIASMETPNPSFKRDAYRRL